MKTRLTKRIKRYLHENYRHKPDRLLAKELGVSESFVRKALEQLHLKRTVEEDMTVQVSASRKSKTSNLSDFFSAHRYFVSSLIIIGLVCIGLITYFTLNRIFASEESKSIREIKKILAPYKGSDLNLLVFTLDTTRADHLGCYGYKQVDTPNIDQLAKNGVLFKTAISQSPLTLPSHSSIFTGTYPLYHGVRDNGGFYLEPEHMTLAEMLKKRGWNTSAFVGAFVLDSRWGLDQGFDYYYDNFDFAKYKKVSLSTVQREGGEVIDAFFEWFEKNNQAKFFSWIHLYDPHTPYDPPEPYKSQYSHRRWGLYDGEIAYVDNLIGKVLERLKQKNLLEETIIVIVGDHGESLGEHHENTHGFFIYDATVHVPLILKIPSSKLKGRIIESQVNCVDILPSILQVLGISVPKEVQGNSFLPAILGKDADIEQLAYSETYYPRYHYGWSELKSIRSSRYKFIHAPKPELYDLTQDPDEKSNIYDQKASEAKRYEKELKELEEKMSVEGIEEKNPQKMDQEAEEKLRALGYIGGFTSSAKLSKTKNLADPKDKIFLYIRIKMAEGYAANEDYDKALQEINPVIAEDPGIMEARQVRAQIFLRIGRSEEAIEDCQEALKIDPEYESAILTLAHAYRLQEKYDDAIAGYDRLIQLNPRDARPHVNLGDIYLKLKDIDKATSHLQQAIEMDPEMSSRAHNLLGSAYLEKKKLEEAEQEITKALELRPRIPDAHYFLALLYEERQDFSRALEEYKKEIELHPAAYPAHYNLALLYGKMGSPQEQIKHLKECINHNKNFSKAYLFLAKAYLDLEQNFDEAIRLAKKGLELEPESEAAPLGHYILADIYNRMGRWKEYNSELQKGKELEKKLKDLSNTQYQEE
jgi:arylsulfatase A-like enzyme/Tfp pilus assembly protein PilF